MRHHLFWMMMYGNDFPLVITHNLRNPLMPVFVDGQDITIYRPAQPGHYHTSVGQGTQDCCQCCTCGCCDCRCNCDCCDCRCNCDDCLVKCIRYFQNSFLVLSGYHALQCGTLCGPCVRSCCYDPCVG